jgi:HEAT repeat protein
MMESRLAELERLSEVEPAHRAEAFALALRESAAKEPRIRAVAAQSIAWTGGPDEALSRLAQLAGDPDVGVRMAAVSAVAGLRWRGRLDVLASRLSEADLGVRAVAADGLAHAGDARASATLVELTDVRPLRFTALEALLSLGAPALRPIAARLMGGFFVPPFERALAEVVFAAEGSPEARASLRRRLDKRRAEERPFVLVHLARVDPDEGRAMVERIAADPTDYLRESAILALTRLDSSWWPRAQEAIGRTVDEDPHVAGEVLLGLFEIDWTRASLVAESHVRREGELGVAARQVRLGAALGAAHPAEILLRCA